MGGTIETYIVDSFTDVAFKGNPAGVCILQDSLSDTLMLSIAKELGLSETAFILPMSEPNCFRIRFFSPVMEIPLCGHATLASAKVIYSKYPNLEDVHFFNIQDLDLAIKRDGDLLAMQFPIYRTVPQDVPSALLEALGITEVINSEFNQETSILLLEIGDSDFLKSLRPNFQKLIESHDSINGVLITAPSKKENFDFESRYFWPWSGTNEDPATGGTHTFLAKYWSSRLMKNKMMSFQCSARTGWMEVELLSDDKMAIRSQAQIVLQGELRHD